MLEILTVTVHSNIHNSSFNVVICNMLLVRV